MTDTTPLRNIIASFVDEAMIKRIAEEYAKGRLLLIMTTNLDQGRSVIWMARSPPANTLANET